jgi:hypothetical protein
VCPAIPEKASFEVSRMTAVQLRGWKKPGRQAARYVL